MTTDRALQGKRIVFLFSNNPDTRLAQGDRGTIRYERYADVYGDESISVDWDSGLTQNLTRGRDAFTILKEEAS